MECHAPFDSCHHQILDSYIRECPTCHHTVVPTPAAVTIEIDRLNSATNQVFPCGRTRFNRTGRRDVISRYRIPKDAQRPCTPDLFDLADLHRKSFEEWWFLDVITFLVPRIKVPRRRSDLIPFRVLTGKISV